MSCWPLNMRTMWAKPPTHGIPVKYPPTPLGRILFISEHLPGPALPDQTLSQHPPLLALFIVFLCESCPELTLECIIFFHKAKPGTRIQGENQSLLMEEKCSTYPSALDHLSIPAIMQFFYICRGTRKFWMLIALFWAIIIIIRYTKQSLS